MAITGAGGFEPTPIRRLLIAALCCRPVLALPEDSLDDLRQVIVYPGQFRVRRHEAGEHDGVVHEIRVLKDGFEYEARHYTSLSTIAREVTGTSWNGFLWAGLTTRKKRSTTAGGKG